ncbi:MAG: metal ABC transporter ATP-binding protein [Parachlamydia sp.]|jgi:manganese/zinc/iron transport system ATP- binding protein|nr:metal ABC transporter ATP-binding protein [Parachlamydia sp.]
MDTAPSLVPALQIHQMSVNYGKMSALWDITLEIPQGLLVCIAGPNGAGKSTLIKAALGLVKPLSGNVEFFGQPLKKQRQRVAYVPQRESVDWDFPITAKELVLMGRYGKLKVGQRPSVADRAAADHYLEVVGMSSLSNRQISQLSGGQQQRIFLARALLQEADIYFMDEPFAGVDIATETAIVQLLQQLRSKGKTVLVVHHDLNTVERYFDWLMLLNIRLIACGKVSDEFTPQNLHAAYGKSYALFDEALRLAQDKQAGVIK